MNTNASTKAPGSKDLFALLIKLYADQEGIEITYEFEEGEVTK